MARLDVIVLGVGAIGSAALYHLARRGRSVLGIDRHSPPHMFGSSHGETRITRTAIGEGVEYSALALRSHALWRDLERATGETLMMQCGCLVIAGHEASPIRGVIDFLGNMQAAARQHGIPHRLFESGAEIRSRFPQFAVRDDERAFLDESGGCLFPEACIRAQLTLARQHGAALKTDTTVTRFTTSASGVRVECADGQSYEADRLLIAAGAWLPRLLGPPFQDMLRVTRQVLTWFEIRSRVELFSASRCPVFIWQVSGDAAIRSDIYGFPLIGDAGAGLKIAHEEDDDEVDPDHLERMVRADEIAHVYATYVAPFFPDVGPRCIKTDICLYTRSPGARFVIDAHPEHPRILFASACSGHGFKHAPAIGEALADALCGQEPQVDLRPFRLGVT
jgi:sarcosine oxidase